ncbi:hypothetical protein J3F83DRAFT_743520 [Trichoderma novae-zelandiae]
MANTAAFSMLRAANSGPFSFILPLVRTPCKLVESIPAFLVLVLWLSSLVISASSTILLTDFQDYKFFKVAYYAAAQVFQSSPDFFDSTRAISTSSPGVWHQALLDYPIFGEAILELPSETDSLSDTGLIKRSILPLASDWWSKFYAYEGPSFTYTSRVGCTRPALSGFLSGIRFDTVEAPVMEEARLSGTLTWESQDEYQFLDGLSCGVTGTACPSMSFDCALPYASYQKGALERILDSEAPTSLCILRNEDYTAEGPRPGFLLVWETNVDAEHWGGIHATHTGSQLALPQQTNASEWAVLGFGGSLTLNATLCLFNSTMELEIIALGGSLSAADASLMYDVPSGVWLAETVVDRLTPFSYDGIRSGPVPANNELRHIMTLNSSTTVTPDKADEIFSLGSPENDPQRITDSMSMATKFLQKMKDSVSFPFSDSEAPPESGNFSIYVCASCRELGGRSLRPHLYQAIVFHAIVDKTASVAQALHAMLFSLYSAQYYNALPMSDIWTKTKLTIAGGSVGPASYSGLVAVGVVLLLHLISVYVVTGLFLARTRWSLYGNMWHAVAQLVAGPEVRLALEDTTMTTDKGVRDRLQKHGINEMNVGLWDQGNGRIVVASGRVSAAVEAGRESVDDGTETVAATSVTESVVDDAGRESVGSRSLTSVRS